MALIDCEKCLLNQLNNKNKYLFVRVRSVWLKLVKNTTLDSRDNLNSIKSSANQAWLMDHKYPPFS